MIIHGLQKMTLLDYPGKVGCIVFTAGCNFRCPFCHNAPLVTDCRADARLDEDEVLAYLEKRRGILDGVVISGGEPTLQADLPDFIRRVRALGYAVKLDTNGTHPAMLRALLAEGLLDYVAMDVKNAPEKYAATVGVEPFDLAPIQESMRILSESGVDYEYRTTVTAELHTPDDVAAIAEWCAGAPHYYIQPFVDSGDLVGKGAQSAPERAVLDEMLTKSQHFIPKTAIRGTN